jgi:large subunit ribosomal protein L4
MESKILLENIEAKKQAIGLIHKVYLAQIKTVRKYTACTKTKSEVRGGGRKPWRQKGTGQARAGSSRSPLWVGGGVSFGPKPRVVNKKINKKERRLAILSALYLKKDQLKLIEENEIRNFSSIKTKDAVSFLNTLKVKNDNKILIVLTKPNKSLLLATRNLKNIEVTLGNCLNLKQLLHSTQIIMSNASLELINLTYGKS